MVAAVIAVILGTICVPLYTNYVDRAKNRRAMADILTIQAAAQRYYTETFAFPDTLADIDMEHMSDPWENAYQYLNFANVKGKGGLRKDRSQVPLNTDYDLYSMGKDGKTNQSLRPKVSHDDIIRARDGSYIGLASEY